MNNSLEGYAAALELICKKRKVGKKAIQKFMYLKVVLGGKNNAIFKLLINNLLNNKRTSHH
jgi:hypothetical protein